MKRVAVISLLLILCTSLIISVPLDGDSNVLRIQEIMPHGGSEGFSIHNYGSSDADIKGYSVTDGEGYVSFTSSLIVPANTSVTILNNEPDDWLIDRNIFIHDFEGIESKNFQLNDKGDEIVLLDPAGKILDVVVYGTGFHELWKGTNITIPKGQIAIRTSAFDTDSATDWSSTIPGRSSYEKGLFDSTVIPFTFPESSGYPVFEALSSASKEVLISIYILDHPGIVYILTQLLSRNVDVKILVEGSPSGGVPENEIGYLELLSRHGAEISVMKNLNEFRRYAYIHNKYAVIDSETVVITTENWRRSSFENNRGWGLISFSKEHAEYMRALFFEDMDEKYNDVHSFSSVYPYALPKDVQKFTFDQAYYEKFHTTVSPMLCPDFAFDSLKKIIQTAEFRVYSQQMSVHIDWITDDDPVAVMMRSASNGVDCRLMVDVTFDDPYDNDNNDGYWLKELTKNSHLLVRTSDDSTFGGMIHNKSMIVDDSVWIGSMNWNHNSFKNNREVGVIIHSKDVTEYLASMFLEDWGVTEDIIDLKIDTEVKNGYVILDASGSKVLSGSVFDWDLDSDGVTERKGKKIVVKLPNGWNDCVLYVKGPDGVVMEKPLSVFVPEQSVNSILKYIPILAICAIVITVRVLRIMKGNDTRTP